MQFSKILLLFILLILINSNTWAIITSCPGEPISNLDGATTNAYNQDSGKISGNTNYYYNFTPDVNGTIEVSSYISGTSNSLSIKNGCGASLWNDSRSGNYKASPKIDVLEGKKIVIELSRTYWTKQNFNINFDFKATNIPPVITPASFEIKKTLSTGANVGTVETSPQATSYTIVSGNEESIFSINSNGLIKIANSSSLTKSDFSSYILKIEASNSYGTGLPEDIIINIDIDYSKKNIRTFTKRLINNSNATNINGELKIIGNQVLCSTNDGKSCKNPGSSASNNSIYQKHVNLDTSDASLESSTMASLSLDAGDKIIWAGLYWQGRIVGENSKRATANKVLLKTPNTDSYVTVTSKLSAFNWYPDGSTWDYAGMQEVTEYVKSAGDIWVANVQSTEGKNMGAGWALSVIIKNPDKTLTNISVYDGFQGVFNSSGYPASVSSNITNFLTPLSGDIKSSLFYFANETDRSLKDSTSVTKKDGTTVYLSNKVNPKNNVMNATISNFGTNVTTRNPNWENVLGMDIDQFDVSDIMDNGQTSTTITINSDDDRYFLSLYAFTTELYEPRVCYYIDNIKDSKGTTIFEDAKDGSGPRFTDELKQNEVYTYTVWLSNMKKNKTDPDIENARLVQVYMDMYNFKYKSDSTWINNINDTNRRISDSIKQTNDDIGEHNASLKRSTWRIGVGADNLQGGTLNATTFSSITDTSNKAIISFDGALSLDENTTSISLTDIFEFKASFQTDSIRIGAENAQLIAQCQDLNVTGVVSGLLGAFNIVNENGGNNTFEDASSDQTYLTTQIANKAFNVKIISLNANRDALLAKTDDLNVSLIKYPYSECDPNNETCKQNACDNAPPLGTPKPVKINGVSKVESFTFSNAYKNVMFKISYNNGTQHSCSLDVFAIRPEKFELTPPSDEDKDLLTAGKSYNLALKATQYLSPNEDKTNPTIGYTVNSVSSSDFNASSEKYLPNAGGVDKTLKGRLTFAQVPFNIIDGVSYNGASNEVVGISYDNVGLINIKIQDKTWAQVDIDNEDTPADCTQDGAYICGDINTTFIPDHFTLSSVKLHNNNEGFTYFSNDFNQSAKLSLKITAEKYGGGKVSNFREGLYEHNVSVEFTAPDAYSTTANKKVIATNLLGFGTEANTTLKWDETNVSKQLQFNYTRDINDAKNPIQVNGADVNLVATSTYTGASGTTKDVTGTAPATSDATFVYGRTHAPRQRFSDNATPTEKDVFIYYEIFCHGVGCDKNLLPDKGASEITDDPRWWINTKHRNASGKATDVEEKSATGHIEVSTTTVPTGNHPDKALVKYTGNKGYPYITTMKNKAPSWLIYNKYNTNADTNEFTLEFYKDAGEYVGSGTSNHSVKIKRDTTQLNVNENKSWW